jgi:tetratricopeptide (TPR) repeat protein
MAAFQGRRAAGSLLVDGLGRPSYCIPLKCYQLRRPELGNAKEVAIARSTNMSDSTPSLNLRRSPRCAWCVVIATIAGVVATTVFFTRSRDVPTERAADSSADSANEELAELGQAHQAAQRGDFETALAHVDRAVELGADRVEIHLLRAELLFRLFRSDEMIPSLERSLELEPSRFEAHANLAYALRYVGRLDEAEREARWCLSQRPEFVPARRILAEIHRDRGDPDAAWEEVQRALEADPRDLDSRLLEANLLIYRREFESAHERLTPLLRRHRWNHRLLAALTRTAQMTGRDKEAAAYRADLSKLNAKKLDAEK